MSDPMESAKNPSGLRLVSPKEQQNAVDNLRNSLPAQISLFPIAKHRIIVFVTFSRITDTEFIETLDAVRPNVVIDIRRFPRFDIGKLNRATAFEYFEKSHTKYVDLLWSHDLSQKSNETTSPYPLLSPELVSTNGPVMILLEVKQCKPDVVDTVTRQIATRSNQEWDIIGVPSLCPSF